MALLDKYLNAEVKRKEASFDYDGETYRFASDDPDYDAGLQLLEMNNTKDAQDEADHYTATLGKKIALKTVLDAKQIAATWDGPDKPGVERLVKLYTRKPDLFLAMVTCSGEVLTVDEVLMKYVYGLARPPQALQDQVNPLVGTGLKNSPSEASSSVDSTTS